MTADSDLQYLFKQNSARFKKKPEHPKPTEICHHYSVIDEAPNEGFKSEYRRCPAPPASRSPGVRGGSTGRDPLAPGRRRRGSGARKGTPLLLSPRQIKRACQSGERRTSPFPFSPAASTHPRRPGRGGRRDRALRQGPAPTVGQLHGAGAAQGPREPVELLHGSLHPRSAQPGAADTPLPPPALSPSRRWQRPARPGRRHPGRLRACAGRSWGRWRSPSVCFFRRRKEVWRP